MLKFLTYLFIFANLVVGLWIYANPEPADSRDLIKATPEGKRLILLSELYPPEETAELNNSNDNDQVDTQVNEDEENNPSESIAAADESEELDIISEEVAEAETVAPAQELVLACYTVGPFTTRSLAENFAETMQSVGLSVSQREKIEQLILGYRVYIEPLASREEARVLARELNDLGVNDYFIINDDEFKNGISLGLFKQKSGAIRRMAQIRRFNFDVKMEARQRDTSIVWLDIEDSNETFTEAYWQELSESDAQLQRLSKKCETPIAFN